MAWPPSVADFKAKFTREFVYGDGFDSVRDADIQRGLDEAPPLFNQALLDSSVDQTNAYLYLAAHNMVMNIQSAGGLSAVARGRGVRNVGEGVQVSKGIGQANVTYQVPPERIAESPTLLYFFRTDFGQRYLQMMVSRLAGHMATVCGPDDVFLFKQE
jgi:hypothetical protein